MAGNAKLGAPRYLLAVILNLLPGFGLGYLIVGRRTGFKIGLFGTGFAVIWLVLSGVGTAVCHSPDVGLGCLGWAFAIGAGALLLLAVNVITASHLFIVFVIRLFHLLTGHEDEDD